MAYTSRVRSEPAPAPRPGRSAAPALVLPRLKGWYAGWLGSDAPRSAYNAVRAAAKGLALAGWGWRGADTWSAELALEEGSYGFHQQRVRARDRPALEACGVWAQAEARVRATGEPWPRRRDAQALLVRQALTLLGPDLASPVEWWMGWLPDGDPSALLIQALGIRTVLWGPESDQMVRWGQGWNRYAVPPTAS